eukprot:TRINITY_DN119_c0_g3_i1.p1 TRINITY_DN119_c0_g3~~TRINITY_DN119_c0_g3_i1.p1  ORF type:complete len:1011 (-),score=273.71 TRINITY_DN119_c0_g3_i1:1166-4198(-)
MQEADRVKALLGHIKQLKELVDQRHVAAVEIVARQAGEATCGWAATPAHEAFTAALGELQAAVRQVKLSGGDTHWSLIAGSFRRTTEALRAVIIELQQRGGGSGGGTLPPSPATPRGMAAAALSPLSPDRLAVRTLHDDWAKDTEPGIDEVLQAMRAVHTCALVGEERALIDAVRKFVTASTTCIVHYRARDTALAESMKEIFLLVVSCANSLFHNPGDSSWATRLEQATTDAKRILQDTTTHQHTPPLQAAHTPFSSPLTPNAHTTYTSPIPITPNSPPPPPVSGTADAQRAEVDRLQTGNQPVPVKLLIDEHEKIVQAVSATSVPVSHTSPDLRKRSSSVCTHQHSKSSRNCAASAPLEQQPLTPPTPVSLPTPSPLVASSQHPLASPLTPPARLPSLLTREAPQPKSASAPISDPRTDWDEPPDEVAPSPPLSPAQSTPTQRRSPLSSSLCTTDSGTGSLNEEREAICTAQEQLQQDQKDVLLLLEKIKADREQLEADQAACLAERENIAAERAKLAVQKAQAQIVNISATSEPKHQPPTSAGGSIPDKYACKIMDVLCASVPELGSAFKGMDKKKRVSSVQSVSVLVQQAMSDVADDGGDYSKRKAGSAAVSYFMRRQIRNKVAMFSLTERDHTLANQEDRQRVREREAVVERILNAAAALGELGLSTITQAGACLVNPTEPQLTGPLGELSAAFPQTIVALLAHCRDKIAKDVQSSELFPLNELLQDVLHSVEQSKTSGEVSEHLVAVCSDPCARRMAEGDNDGNFFIACSTVRSCLCQVLSTVSAISKMSTASASTQLFELMSSSTELINCVKALNKCVSTAQYLRATAMPQHSFSVSSEVDEKEPYLWVEILGTPRQYSIQGTEVKYASLNKLVELATSTSFLDHTYLQTFLITAPSFVTPAHLFRKLIERYSVPITPDFEGAARKMIQMRVVVFLNLWVERSFDDFDDFLVARLKKFVDTRLVADGYGDAASLLSTELDRRLKQRHKRSKFLRLPPSDILVR